MVKLIKIAAMCLYESEVKRSLHPRSPRGIITKSRERGIEVGVKHAEAFEVIRDVR